MLAFFKGNRLSVHVQRACPSFCPFLRQRSRPNWLFAFARVNCASLCRSLSFSTIYLAHISLSFPLPHAFLPLSLLFLFRRHYAIFLPVNVYFLVALCSAVLQQAGIPSGGICVNLPVLLADRKLSVISKYACIDRPDRAFREERT